MQHDTGVAEGLVHLALFVSVGLLVVLAVFAGVERLAGTGRPLVRLRALLFAAGAVLLFGAVEVGGHVAGW